MMPSIPSWRCDVDVEVRYKCSGNLWRPAAAPSALLVIICEVIGWPPAPNQGIVLMGDGQRHSPVNPPDVAQLRLPLSSPQQNRPLTMSNKRRI